MNTLIKGIHLLPFLKPKRVAGLIISNRKPDAGSESEKEMDGDEGLHAVSSDMITAIHAKDHKGLSMALKSLKSLMDGMSDPEAEEASDYDSLNEKAAKSQRE